MKTTTIILAAFLAACTTTKVTAPDGTVTETQTVDAAAFTAGVNALTVIAAPKARTVREEKSGPITLEEIDQRFREAK